MGTLGRYHIIQLHVYLTSPNPASLPLWKILILSTNVPAYCPQVWILLQPQPHSSPTSHSLQLGGTSLSYGTLRIKGAEIGPINTTKDPRAFLP